MRQAAPGSVAVVGAGPSGLIAALSLAANGVAVQLIGARPGAEALAADTRSTALFGASLDLLDHIGALGAIGGQATPLSGLRLIDATGGLLRAPEVLFQAHEIGVGAFGCNIENRVLNRVLWELVEANGCVRCRAGAATAVRPDAMGVAVEMSDGTVFDVQLVVGADGERSLCRAAAGIAARTWSYPQAAIATRFAHERPHGGISTEFHRRAGPLTTVPLTPVETGGNRSSLVWVETPAEAGRLAGLDDVEFAIALEAALAGVLGAVSDIGRRAVFPLAGLTAVRFAGQRVALVGEAGHRLPPIGAQGLNLGVRDAAWLAEIVGAAVAEGRDPGGADVLEAYDRARRGDVGARTAAVDGLNRSLIADLLPMDMVRGAGLLALNGLPWLRRLVMREGVAPGGPLPRLLRPVGDKSACGGAEA